VRILPPDINRSAIRWKGSNSAMRVGLLSIKQLGLDTQRRIVRKSKQRLFCSLNDFLDRVRPDEPEARALIHAGAFDALPGRESRAAMLWELAGWQKSRSRRPATRGLFDRGAHTSQPFFPPESEKVRLRHEFTVLGFLCDRHPMVLYADALKRQSIVKARDLRRVSGQHVHMAGLLITGKVVHTKHGDPMEFLTFEDETGLVETTFFPQAYRRFCAILDRSRPFMLYGKVDEDFGVHTLTVEHVKAVTKL